MWLRHHLQAVIYHFQNKTILEELFICIGKRQKKLQRPVENVALTTKGKKTQLVSVTTVEKWAIKVSNSNGNHPTSALNIFKTIKTFFSTLGVWTWTFCTHWQLLFYLYETFFAGITQIGEDEFRKEGPGQGA